MTPSLVAPVVSGFVPDRGEVSREVKIWGTGFSTNKTEDSVSFGGSDYVVVSEFRSGGANNDTLVVCAL